MNNYLLDTNIIINYLHNKEPAVKMINRIKNEHLHINSIVFAEFHVGTMLSKNTEEQNEQFSGFLKAGAIEIYPIDKQAAFVFAQIQSKQIKKGAKKPALDMLIAASCIANDLILVTENKKDFEGIEGLKIC